MKCLGLLRQMYKGYQLWLHFSRVSYFLKNHQYQNKLQKWLVVTESSAFSTTMLLSSVSSVSTRHLCEVVIRITIFFNNLDCRLLSVKNLHCCHRIRRIQYAPHANQLISYALQLLSIFFVYVLNILYVSPQLF
jgi:hypothetical protein